MSMRLGYAFLLWCLMAQCHAAWYDTYTGNQITDERLAELRLNQLIPWCAIEVADCSPNEPRRLDYSCNNIHYPARGAILTPYHRMLPPNFATNGGVRVAKSGRDLPNARDLRVSLVTDGRISSKRHTLMLASLNVFIIGDVTSVHDTVNYVAVTRTCCLPGGAADPRCIPIRVADDDLHLRPSNVRCLNLTRSITYQRLGCTPTTLPPERINTAPPMLDLSLQYGSEEYRSLRIREGLGGRLRSEVLKGKEWPPGNASVCINNMDNETRCHDSGDIGTNSLMGLNIIYMWFFRNHNHIARKLERINPCWNDDQLYAVAKDINIAMLQQILYYELMVVNMGYEYLVKRKVLFPYGGYVDDYDHTLEPRVSLEYVQATRWFHTQQEGRWNLYNRQGKVYDQLQVVDLTLRTGILPLNNTLEGLTQGIFRQAGTSTDYVVDPDMGERVLGRLQFVSDVLASDMMKTRDVGLPPYNKYRELCGLPVAKHFKDLLQWMPVEQVEAMERAYEDIDDVDLYAGILSEYPMEGAVTGPTLACIMTDQLLRWRRADRFWFEHPDRPSPFTLDQLQEIRKTTMASLICLHGDSVYEVQPNVFYLPGPGNELISCKSYPPINYEVWQDPSCIRADNYKNPYVQSYRSWWK